MNQVLFTELENNRKRLEYYTQLREKNAKSKSIDTWIEIYSERVRKLERQANKLGLKTQIATESAQHARGA